MRNHFGQTGRILVLLAIALALFAARGLAEDTREERSVTITLKPNAITSRPFDTTRNLGVVKTITREDGTRTLVLDPAFFTKDDFVIHSENIAEGDSVTITHVTVTKPETPDAGTYTLPVSFELESNSNTYRYVAGKDSISSVQFTITPKPVALSVVNKDNPGKGLTKGYGDPDPELEVSSVGMYKTDVDKLQYDEPTREPGEDVGSYPIIVNNLTAGPNYSLSLKQPAELTITAKDVKGLRLTPPDGQRYTGKPLTPDVTLMNGETRLVRGTDYTLIYKNNTEVGTADVTITGKGNYTGTATTQFKIVNTSVKLPRTLVMTYNDALDKPTKVYDGTTDCMGLKMGDFVVSNYADGDKPTVEITSMKYDVADVGNSRRVTVTFKVTSKHDNYEYSAGDCVIDRCSITPVDITDKKNKVSIDDIPDQSYNGTVVTPDIKVTWGNKTLTADDYTIKYRDSTLATGKTTGTGVAVVTGKGNFTGTLEKSFKIVDDRGKTGRTVKITLKSGKNPTKVYDKTRNFGYYDSGKVYHPLLTATDFDIAGVASGDKVTINRVNLGSFSSMDVGTYNVSVGFDLSPAAGNTYKYTVSSDSVYSVRATITKRTIVVEPTAGQNKYFGSTEPSSFRAVVSSGLLIGDTITGALGRQSGENAGTYKYNKGTLSAGNNYDITVKDGAVFTIKPKPINATDITVEAISNQKYTGSAIQPNVTVRYGSRTLSKGTDYTVSYRNNTNKGFATATLTGKGNFTGTRNIAFRIIGAQVPIENLDPSILPKNLRTVNANAFSGDTALKCVELPEGVESIGARAFADCANLCLIRIPASVTTIAFDAFDGCDRLRISCPAGSAAEKFAQTCNIEYVIE